MTEQASAPSGLKVLFVEDYAPSAALLLETFKWHAPDIHLDTVSTAAGAIERLDRFERELAVASLDGAAWAPRYDVVLTDLNLPDGSGLAILAHVHSHRLMLAVVILTAETGKSTVIDTLGAGAHGYVTKCDDYLTRLPSVLRAAAKRLHSEAGGASAL